MAKTLLIIIIFLIFPSLKGINTACYNRAGLTEAQKTELLRKHNELRNIVASGQQAPQPSASNMQ